MDISVGRDYLVIDGKPRFIYGGDLNYCRVRRRWWRDRLRKMKAAGMNTVAFYCAWLAHEPEEGQWVFEGECDLAAFMDLAQAEGLFTIVRIGPFIHAEARNGGLPQWLVDRLGSRVRSNDDEYLSYAGKWCDQVLSIVAPRLVTRGGSAILIQMENELGSAGSKGDDVHRGSEDPGERGKHIGFYNAYLGKHGIDIPVIDINKPYPGKEELPLVDTGGGYPVNCFGCDGELSEINLTWWNQHTRPRVTIETMGGMFARYYDWPPYRHTNGYQGPIVEPEVVEAFAYQHLAEGFNGINFYVMADGEYLDGAAERMLPQRVYGYQAPLSVGGNLRASYKAIKRLGWFLRAFEAEVVTSQPLESWAQATSYGIAHPGVEGAGIDLFDGYHREAEGAQGAPRHIRKVKAGGRVNKGLNLSESNFLIMINARNHGSAWQRDIRVETNSAGIPCEVCQEYPKRTQMELAPQENKIMPFFVRLAPGHFLEYSTATPLDRRAYGEGVQVIFHNRADATTETRFVVPEACPVRCMNGSLVTWESPCAVSVVGLAGSDMEVVELAAPTPVRYVLMNTERAGDVWDVASPYGALVASSSLRVMESAVDESRTRLTLQAAAGDFYIYLLSPARPKLRGAFTGLQEEYNAEFGLYKAIGSIDAAAPEVAFTKRFEGRDLVWEAEVGPGMVGETLTELCLQVSYDGTQAYAYLDDTLISDHAFGRFQTWEVHLLDRLRTPGRLRLVMQNAHEASVAVQGVAEVGAAFDWGEGSSHREDAKERKGERE